jgi:hypothetical protein
MISHQKSPAVNLVLGENAVITGKLSKDQNIETMAFSGHDRPWARLRCQFPRKPHLFIIRGIEEPRLIICQE